MFARFGQGFRGGPGGGFPGGGYGMRGGGFGMRGGGFGAHFFPLGGLFFSVFAIAMVAVVMFLFWRILTKAGFEGALALLLLVPLLNIGVIAYLALADWPVLKELQDRRMHYARTAVPDVTQAAPAPAVPGDEAETVIVPTQPLDPVTDRKPADD